MAKIKANANNCQNSAKGQRYNFPGRGGKGGEGKGCKRGDARFSWRPKGEFSVAWHLANGCRESYSGRRGRHDARHKWEEARTRDSVATPNFNSLITGARATSCQGARIFQTIVFVNPSGLARARRPYIRAHVHPREAHEHTYVHLHIDFAFTTSCSLPEREHIDPCRLAFLSRESPSVCQHLCRMSQKAPRYQSDWVESSVAMAGE